RCHGLHLAAVAGRQEHRLGETGGPQAAQQLRLALLLDIERFAQGRGTAAMTDADDEKVGHHSYRNRARRSSSSASGTAVCSPLSRSRRPASPLASSSSPRMMAAAAPSLSARFSRLPILPP